MKQLKNTNEPHLRLRHLIKEISNRCGQQDDKLCGGIGLNVSESNVLSAFGREKEITSSEIANKLELSNSRITRIIDNLIDKKLVKRNYSTTDRRIINLTLSEKGFEKSKLLEHKYCKCYEDIINNSDEGEIKKIMDSLEKLIKLMSN
jgi:DNA-binding MarR family transcriptional regulator